MTYTSDFGRIVLAWRHQNGFSRHRLAELTGFSEDSIRAWENGRTLPGYDAIICFSKTMGVSSDYLLGMTSEWRPSGYFIANKS
jgi:transcriptional regulator with XRE-family HTH domain